MSVTPAVLERSPARQGARSDRAPGPSPAQPREDWQTLRGQLLSAVAFSIYGSSGLRETVSMADFGVCFQTWDCKGILIRD
jgi:hypothetical protein